MVNFVSKNITAPIAVLLLGAVLINACAPVQKTSSTSNNYTLPKNFNTDSYINPQEYGYQLLNPNENSHDSADTSFVPVTVNARKMQTKVQYPSEARRMGIQGRVILEIYVDSTSRIQNIRTIESPHPLLTKSSKEAAIRTHYEAATLDNSPVNSFLRIPMIFQMR